MIRWGSVLTPETLTRIEAVLGKDLDKLGPLEPDDAANDVPAAEDDEDKEGE